MSYTEDSIVEQSALSIFQEMQWQNLNVYKEDFGENGTLGRFNRSEVVLRPRLLHALEKLNPAISKTSLSEAADMIMRDRSAMSPIAANQEVYKIIKDGLKLSVHNDEGESEDVTLRVIDWEQPKENDFLLCSQFWIMGETQPKRADLIGFVNGLPLVFIELKSSHAKLSKAYNENLKDYKSSIPQLFWYNQLIILSNGIASKIGTVSSSWEHFSEWKKIEREDEPRRVSLEVILRGTCEKNRLLDLIENFTLYITKKETVKIVAKYHQFLGVNQSLKGIKHIKEIEGKLGVFWHTQGSGKSFSMTFFAQKIFRKIPGNWTFVIVTDRSDLDDQIYKGFHSAGVLAEECQADSGDDLRRLLSEDHRFVFTLIQKFRAPLGETYPLLSERDDVIVITDEAHRSQYSSMAMNMRSALPKASFIAFTGTPLLSGEERTKEVFGDYVSVYNFSDAVEDGATLPLYYENRVPEVGLKRDDLGDAILELLDEADLSDEQESKMEREFASAYHIITRKERLETIAHDIVEHFMGREYMGKAMTVSIDKPTAIKMYDLVQIAWKAKIEQLEAESKTARGSVLSKLQNDIEYMRQTDMAVVVSGGAGEEDRLRSRGVEIAPHRYRMEHERLDEKFKDPDDQLRIVFVCAMWLTGFDAPAVSTLYLDKPLKSHTLMQAIARANRLFPGKPNGQVVDYISIFGALREALGLYGATLDGSKIDLPAIDKERLYEALMVAMSEAKNFLDDQGVSLQAIINATQLEKLRLLDAASEMMQEPSNKETFTSYLRQINRIFKGILPDVRAEAFIAERVAINVIYQQMRLKAGEDIDDEEVMQVLRDRVNLLLDDAIETVEIKSYLPSPVNISQIDFEALMKMLEQMASPTRSEAERLKNIIERKLNVMIEQNSSRLDLKEKFQELVERYNLGAANAEVFFEELKRFIKEELNPEERRAAREELSEEELAIFDLIASGVELTEKERKEVKKVAHDLLETLKLLLVIDWRKKQQTKAKVRLTIEEVLDRLPQKYDEELWPRSVEMVYQHVFDSFGGLRAS
ncbi:type I site-specific deoxyribonuclease, HsdR family (plasmid) [Sulfuricurvum kujiense DSM 16994]|uniref:Type I restriction enzyme endonuclease subunit n=1 Tax=Sulfuricurvum kujiense (strain ATCC BAA-921 / DSM 16994 / JCM 11577 / YK-1) TaxID=709032 RepID=E4U407_SULKY|nr:type I restriction endonuclease subunit R [Sulfuricurvum kujiense]ADR35423.1 type I site-specific deoxyribonuclease, HsdR family [Sulfuricurvum kujiense DSM 16994]